MFLMVIWRMHKGTKVNKRKIFTTVHQNIFYFDNFIAKICKKKLTLGSNTFAFGQFVADRGKLQYKFRHRM